MTPDCPDLGCLRASVAPPDERAAMRSRCVCAITTQARDQALTDALDVLSVYLVDLMHERRSA
jgi:hypothetical protein